jgi:mono/diheme cytochrome c family protein
MSMIRLRILGAVFLALSSCLNQSFAQNELIERGAYLVEGIAACGACHTPRPSDSIPIADMALAGRLMGKTPVSTVYASNITPDEETGIGTWADDQIVRAIREGIRPDGSVLGPPMPYSLYRNMSDRDARAIVAYLRTVTAVRNTVPRSEYGRPLPANWGPPVGEVPEPDHEDPIAYGAYLAGPLGHCIECHTPRMEGGVYDYQQLGAGGNEYRHGGETTVSSNITPHPELGIGAWTDDEIKTAITQGVSRDGRTQLPMMGVRPYNKVSDEDLDALVSYLRSLEPLPR